jgi:Tfp pilus assembly protein PilF
LSRIQRLCILLAALLLSACGSSPHSPSKIETREPGYEEREASKPQQEPRPPTPPTATSANNALLARAEAASAEGDYSAALAYLERAQRIDPDDAGVYLALARTHVAAGNAAQARAVAERGLLYCQGPAQCESLRQLTR